MKKSWDCTWSKRSTRGSFSLNRVRRPQRARIAGADYYLRQNEARFLAWPQIWFDRLCGENFRAKHGIGDRAKVVLQAPEESFRLHIAAYFRRPFAQGFQERQFEFDLWHGMVFANQCYTKALLEATYVSSFIIASLLPCLS